MNYRFESPEHDLIRVTDGHVIRFVPTDTANSEYRKLSEGVPADEGQGSSAIPPVIITDPYLE